MKYLIMLGDGMADYPIPQLGEKTPLQVAKKPNMDFLAQNGISGLVRTVPEGMTPGSDTANLSVMGYDPKIYYTGRSPLEAISMGIAMAPEDIAFRCNLVTLSDEPDYAAKTMVDYSSDEISTTESIQLVNFLAEHFNNQTLQFYPGISYRHCLVYRGGETGTIMTPPHDITTQKVTGHLPTGVYGGQLLKLMKESYTLLKDHPVNVERVKQGLNPANSCWFWGEGRKPALTSFEERFGLKGAVISAVDLIKGIAICADMESINVIGATGNIHTNFKGKGEAALAAFDRGIDYVYIHVEAPDESGHRNELENKILSIEKIDAEILGPIMAGLKERGEDYRILLLPDHGTPLALRTHVGDPVPFSLYDSRSKNPNNAAAYDEESAAQTGVFVAEGHRLIEDLLKN